MLDILSCDYWVNIDLLTSSTFAKRTHWLAVSNTYLKQFSNVLHMTLLKHTAIEKCLITVIYATDG